MLKNGENIFFFCSRVVNLINYINVLLKYYFKLIYYFIWLLKKGIMTKQQQQQK